MVDPTDPRFLSAGHDIGEQRFEWPIGINLRSVNDPRGAERTATRLTPPRGWASYEAYLTRIAANGATAAEIWLSSWNLALEWRSDWRGYHGLNGYHQANAERLDRLLDRAYELGIRINFVVHNHGMASTRTDREWHNSPYALENGGPVPQATQFYSHPEALAAQQRLRRYLAGRYADHPAVLGWKLFTEMNLTDGYRRDRPAVRAWHRQAAAAWRELDSYNHPITSHWSGDYRPPDRALVSQADTLDYVCIDAYHGRREGRRGQLIADLLWRGRLESGNGLGQFGKPLIVTEYGGNWNAAPIPQLRAEHISGPWAALVSGYAGAPMLWWFEWVDQQQEWGSWAAVGRLPRQRRPPQHQCPAGQLECHQRNRPALVWCMAYHPRQQLFGYILDYNWGYDGRRHPRHEGAVWRIPNARPGLISWEWWDADTGTIIEHGSVEHDGGDLTPGRAAI